MRYNGSNRRLQKRVVNGITTNYVRNIGGTVIAVYDGTTIKERYIWGPTGLVAIVKGSNTSVSWSYTITDHLGSVRSVVDSVGTAVAAYDYFPFGASLRSDENPNRDSRFKFGAKEYNTELYVFLYYFEARFHNPDIGRFASPDPARQGWSYYAFCSNNPMRFADPTGLGPEGCYDEQVQPISRDWLDYDTGPSYAYGGRIPFLDASNTPINWGIEWAHYRRTHPREEYMRGNPDLVRLYLNAYASEEVRSIMYLMESVYWSGYPLSQEVIRIIDSYNRLDYGGFNLYTPVYNILSQYTDIYGFSDADINSILLNISYPTLNRDDFLDTMLHEGYHIISRTVHVADLDLQANPLYYQQMYPNDRVLPISEWYSYYYSHVWSRFVHGYWRLPW
jgi:RHS repeat-associated protein